jgi:hypothetical protein
MGDTGTIGAKVAASPLKTARQRRLQAELRQNLARRKEKARLLSVADAPADARPARPDSGVISDS